LDEEDLIEGCIYLVKHVAHQYASQHSSISFEDLVSEGYVGLVQAARKFDPDRGALFATFAIPRIRGAILDAMRRDSLVSRPMASRIAQYRTEYQDLVDSLDREPTVDEVASRLNLSLKQAAEVMKLRSLRVTSLENQAEVQSRVEDDSASPEEQALQALLGLELKNYLERLQPHDREIIVRIYWWHQRQKEVADALGISASRVSQRRSRALHNLRRMMTEDCKGAAYYFQASA
jgi:RNA polymerase sigma factor FliA